MSIHIILGKPGSGKSFYATRRLIDELCDTNRNIVTNLPLRLDAVNDYVQKRWPDRDLRPLQRIRVLNDEEIRYFWKFRGHSDESHPFLSLVGQEMNEQKKGAMIKELDAWAKTPSMGDEGRGVAYYLDEAHIPFNARAWASVATAALFYLSQHRKLGDIVWPITQAPSNLDKQFRSVAEDFTRVRNEYLAKWGPFKGRGRFVRKTYLAEPTGDKAEPFETASFRLDGIEQCYDTAKGIGVHGNKADVGRRAKGIPIMWVVPGALVLAVLCVAIPWALGKGASRWIAPEHPKATQTGTVHAMPKQVEPSVVRSAVSPPSAYNSNLTFTGFAYGGGNVRVWLSDGRVLENGDGILASVSTNVVRLKDGAVVYRAKVQPAPPPSRPAQTVPATVKPEVDPPPNAQNVYKGEQLFERSSTYDSLVKVAETPTGGGVSARARR